MLSAQSYKTILETQWYVNRKYYKLSSPGEKCGSWVGGRSPTDKAIPPSDIGVRIKSPISGFFAALTAASKRFNRPIKSLCRQYWASDILDETFVKKFVTLHRSLFTVAKYSLRTLHEHDFPKQSKTSTLSEFKSSRVINHASNPVDRSSI